MSKLVAENNQLLPYPEAPNSRANRVKFRSNGSYEKLDGGISRIRIPHNRLSYIDTTQSWIHATPSVVVKGVGLDTAQLAINGLGIESLVRAVRVFVGNRLVNEISDYNKLAAMMQVSNVGSGNSFGNSISSGAGKDARQWNRGQVLKKDEYFINTAKTQITIDEDYTRGFTFNLMGIMGSGNPKMLPIGELSSDIEIQIVWASPWDMYYQDSQVILPNSGATTPVVGRIVNSMTGTVDNVYYDAHVITVSEAVNTEIQKRSRDENGIMSWSGQLWSLDTLIPLSGTLLKAGLTVNQILSGFRYKSLKNIMCAGMAQTNIEQPYVDDGSGTATALTGHRGNVPLNCLGFWGKQQAVRYCISGRYYPQESLVSPAEIAAKTNECFSNHYNGTTNNTFSHFSTGNDQRLYRNGTAGVLQYNNINCKQVDRDSASPPTYVATPFMANPATVSVVPLEDSEISGNNGIDTTAVQVSLTSTIDPVDTTGFNNTDCNLDALVAANYDCLYSINKDGLLSVSY